MEERFVHRPGKRSPFRFSFPNTSRSAWWSANKRCGASVSITFVSERGAADRDLASRLRSTGRMVEPIRGARGLTRADLARNRATAPIEIDPSDGRVHLAGRALAVDPVSGDLPLHRRYLLR